MLTRRSQADVRQTLCGGGVGLLHGTLISSTVIPAESGNCHCVRTVFFSVSDRKPVPYCSIVSKNGYLHHARVPLDPAEVFDDAPSCRRIRALNGDVLSWPCLQVDGRDDT